ncbi:MAG: ATP12 family protein [Pseudomonadota bacterium]
MSERDAPQLPKRFYTRVEVEALASGAHVLLDGRAVKTPAKRPLVVPTVALARALGDEWDAQEDVIDPASMPLTRLANSTIDGVADSAEAVRDEIVKFASSDLLCYRATHPEGLKALQTERWDPLLQQVHERMGARFLTSDGVMPVAQDGTALDAVRNAIATATPFALAALHVVTTLTGSALLAVLLEREAISADAAWEAAHLDEDWQIARWGEDHEAAVRRAGRLAEFQAAVRMLALSKEGAPAGDVAP